MKQCLDGRWIKPRRRLLATCFDQPIGQARSYAGTLHQNGKALERSSFHTTPKAIEKCCTGWPPLDLH